MTKTCTKEFELSRKPGIFLAVLSALVVSVPALAGDQETTFVLNSFSFLIWGCLVMWMCAGFLMLEAGSVRTKNASVICFKNIGLFSIAGLMYYMIGYNLMYTDVDAYGFFGKFEFFYQTSEAEMALLDGETHRLAEVTSNGYSVMSDWFFQMVFVATAASIVSGALAERVRLSSFLIFIVFLTGIIYPIVGALTWGGGWLTSNGFSDFAGSTIVHSTGGWAALAGALILGPRLGKFRKDGSIKSTPPSNVPMVTLGVFILWFGWFGFNGGSVLALGDAASAVTMSNVLANTNLGASAGLVVSLIIARPLFGRVDLLAGLNGAIAGLVAITAAPDMANPTLAIFIGGVGGAICALGIKLLEILKIDDVVGAIPAHLFAGIWGTLAVAFGPNAEFLDQLMGVLVVGAFVFVSSGIVWYVLEKTIGVRISEKAEQMGQDVMELNIDAYPEFVINAESEMDSL